ncbi:helix-turn-helix domain-containing protein [Roseibium sp.]|uniref:helix-turn-helix domain-containing protein n=1 Tax=Roseibium sp. TaxID=1936156 RepID=UPI003A97235A
MKTASACTPPRRLDRLSALIERFRILAQVIQLDDAIEERGGLFVFRNAEGRMRLAFSPNRQPGDIPCDSERVQSGETLAAAARISVSGAGDHLIAALPKCIAIELDDAPDIAAVVLPLVAEIERPRCGGQAVVHRLSEIVVIRLLRHALETGAADFGALAGLSHPRLARAIVAIHEHPETAWSLESLAEEAGMSRTQFAVSFKDTVGMTPGAYLSNWRLDMARAELEGGEQVGKVARMCGFASPAAFSRAFARRFGHTPKAERRKVVA